MTSFEDLFDKPFDFSAYVKKTDDGEVVEIVPLTFGRARITIGDGTTYVRDSW